MNTAMSTKSTIFTMPPTTKLATAAMIASTKSVLSFVVSLCFRKIKIYTKSWKPPEMTAKTASATMAVAANDIAASSSGST